MKSSLVGIGVVLGAGLLAFDPNSANASFAGYEWAGDTCMPSPYDITHYTFIQDAGETIHAASPGTVVTLHCPVTRGYLEYPTPLYPNYIQLSYVDSSHDPGTSVVATLMQMSLADGSVKPIATASSDRLLLCDVGYPYDCQDGQHHETVGAIGPHMDMLAYIYYVEIKLSRAKDTDNAVFAGVQLLRR